MQPAMERLTGSGQPRALATTSGQVMVDSIDGSTPLPGAEDEDPLYIPGHGHQAPLAANLVEPAQQELSEDQDRLDDAEYRLRAVFAPSVEFLAFGRRQAMDHGFERRRVVRRRWRRGKALVQEGMMRRAAGREQRRDPGRGTSCDIGGAKIAAVAKQRLRLAQIGRQRGQLAQHGLDLLLVIGGL